MDIIKHIQITITGEAGEKLTGLYDGHGNPLSNNCYQIHTIIAQLPSGPRMPPISDSDAAGRIAELEARLEAASDEREAHSGDLAKALADVEAAVAARADTERRVAELEAQLTAAHAPSADTSASTAFATEALEGFTVAELRDHAERNAVDLSGLHLKDDIIAAIIAAESTAQAEGDQADDG